VTAFRTRWLAAIRHLHPTERFASFAGLRPGAARADVSRNATRIVIKPGTFPVAYSLALTKSRQSRWNRRMSVAYSKPELLPFLTSVSPT
jgi:hypothetical protein